MLSDHKAVDSSSHYLMDVMSKTKKRMVIIDGSPRKGNLGGYANYAPWEVANAFFLDDYPNTPPEYDTFVLMVAKHDIPHGQEIRADYDTANEHHEFRRAMLANGVAATQLDRNDYLAVLWRDPEQWVGHRAEPPRTRINNVDAVVREIGKRRRSRRLRPGGIPASERFVQVSTKRPRLR